jgi:hypothetical protein
MPIGMLAEDLYARLQAGEWMCAVLRSRWLGLSFGLSISL